MVSDPTRTESTTITFLQTSTASLGDGALAAAAGPAGDEVEYFLLDSPDRPPADAGRLREAGLGHQRVDGRVGQRAGAERLDAAEHTRTLLPDYAVGGRCHGLRAGRRRGRRAARLAGAGVLPIIGGSRSRGPFPPEPTVADDVQSWRGQAVRQHSPGRPSFRLPSIVAVDAPQERRSVRSVGLGP